MEESQFLQQKDSLLKRVSISLKGTDIKVNIDKDRMIPAKHFGKSGGNSLGKRAGYSGMDTDDMNMFYGSKLIHYCV